MPAAAVNTKNGSMHRPDLTPTAKRRMARREAQRKRSGRHPVLVEQDFDLKLLERNPRRDDLPLTWPGVSNFSEHWDELSQTDVVRIAKYSGHFEQLIEDTNYDTGTGRPRDPGDACLAFMAFMHSGAADIQPWIRETPAELWWECGFKKRPSYETVRNRFIELERRALEDFFQVSGALIRVAIEKTGGRVCFDLAIDCTEADTHARLHHDCQAGEGCPGWALPHTDRHGRPRQPNGAAKTPARLPTQDVTAARHRRAQTALDENGNEESVRGDVERSYYDEGRGVLRVRVGQHWFRCLDPTAGARAQKGKNGGVKFWMGFYNLKLICRTFTETAVNIVESADEQELNLLPDALERLLAILPEGHKVRSIGADKGFATKRNCQLLLDHGITPVFPFRNYKNEKRERRDREQFDRDGIPRCKFCGGETEFVRFAHEPKPRLWFRCKRPHPGCLEKKAKPGQPRRPKEQTILCSTDPRYLLPLWRNTSAYQALEQLGLSTERPHYLGRVRNRNGGKNEETRPKRIGRDWQQLRAHAAVCVNWLKILWMQGWVDGFIRNHELPYYDDGSAFVAKMEKYRRAEGLTEPYGKPAIALGIGRHRPGTPEFIDPDPRDYEISGSQLFYQARSSSTRATSRRSRPSTARSKS